MDSHATQHEELKYPRARHAHHGAVSAQTTPSELPAGTAGGEAPTAYPRCGFRGSALGAILVSVLSHTVPLSVIQLLLPRHTRRRVHVSVKTRGVYTEFSVTELLVLGHLLRQIENLTWLA